MTRGQVFSRLWSALFPYIPKCVGCGIEKNVAAYLCPTCADELSDLEAGIASAAGYPACAVYRYNDLAARVVKSYKYGGNRWLSAFMTEAMTQALFRHQIGFDCVCHVPLHRKKRCKRGFDQAALLAQGIASLTGKPYIEALKRVRNTPSQTKLNAKERKDNIRGAFVATEKVEGRILLIDDVLTTGATAAECAAVLQEAGAQSVTVLTFAQAVS